MTHRPSALLLAAVLAFAADVRFVHGVELRGVLGNYSLATWGPAEGLDSGAIWVIAQDADGYLWLGTDGGPVRFDGVRFLRHEVLGVAALPSGPVRALYASRDGSVWFGFGGQGGVSRLRRGEVTHFNEGLAQGTVSLLFEHPDGTMWAGTDGGLYSLGGSRWEQSKGVAPVPVHAVYVDGAGRFLVGTSIGLYRRDPGEDGFEQSDVPTSGVRGIVEDSFGTLWVTDETVGFRQVADPRISQSSDPVRGRRLLHDARGNLWLGTVGRGLWRLRTGPKRQTIAVEKTTALTGFTVTSLLEDREGNVWAGTADGLNRLTPHKVTPLTDLGSVRGVEMTADASIWVGTLDALFRFQEGDLTLRGGPEPLPGPLTAMHVDERGRLWVATERGLFRLDNGRLSPVPLPRGRPLQIRAISSDSLGGVWIHDAEQGVARLRNGRLEPLQVPPQLQRVEISATHTDKTGRTWIAFANGWLGLVARSGHVQFFGPQDGLEAGVVYRALYQDAHGAIWLGGSDGLARFAEGRFATLALADDFPTGAVTAIVEDQSSCLWLAIQGAAIVQIPRIELERAMADPSYRPRHHVHDQFEGLAGTPRWFGNRSAVQARDGQLWFVGGRGVTVIDPGVFSDAAPPVQVRIEGAYVDDRWIHTAPGTQFSPRTTRLEIQYAALNLTSPLKTRFRHRLEGFDPDWVEAGSGRDALFTRLPAGSYEFQVSASNDDGTWTEPVAWAFSIAPRFYQTTWFAAICLCLVIGAVAGSWRLHLRQIRGRFALVLAERARLSREIHDTLLQSLVGVALEFDDISSQLEPSAGPLKDQVGRAREQVEHYIREARRSILDLRSPALETTDLATALRNFGCSATSCGDVRFEFVVKGKPRRLGVDVEEQLLRIGQEAVSNALRHGSAEVVRMELTYDPASVRLTISDNGRGFNPEGVLHDGEPHWGLTSMRERAQQIGGRLLLVSSPGQGTTVETVASLSNM